MIVYHELTLFDVSPRGGVRARAISDGSTDETAATSSYRAVVVSLLCGSLGWILTPARPS